MKASELITELEEQIQKHGDLDVKIYDWRDGGYMDLSVYRATSIVDSYVQTFIAVDIE